MSTPILPSTGVEARSHAQGAVTVADDTAPWYAGVTRYEWLVLAIASLGWVFDVFEGQIFVASMGEAMPSLVARGTSAGTIALYNSIALGAFLLGGSIGGILFGVLSDRIGRKRTLSLTILSYSLFTCLSAFAQTWWHLAAFRFLVALGVGGEWAVASSLVAEVFPARARAHAGGIFHATSVLGTYLAVAAGAFLIGNTAVNAWAQGLHGSWIAQVVDPVSLPWRLGFAIGLVPALLIVWVRRSVREPEGWQRARARADRAPGEEMGQLAGLFRGDLLRRTLVGVTLAAVAMATFWGVHIYGKNMLQAAVERRYVAEAVAEAQVTDASTATATTAITPPASLSATQRSAILAPHAARLKRWEMLGMFLVTTGGGIGLLAFGPISQRIGRRRTFLLYHLGGLVSTLVVFKVLTSVTALVVALPIFGMLTLGMHAGYAIYFPELYPTRLRGTGTGFCFNAGRAAAAPIVFLVGWLQSSYGISLPNVSASASLLFLVGAAVLAFAPETRGRELTP
ncbi:MAG: MFS transporter [Gemmatimonadaceae bacterium]